MAKFFNIDLHCSVITDVARQFGALGHTVDSHNMSGHCWALDVTPASRGAGSTPQAKIGYGSLNRDTWPAMFRDTRETKTADDFLQQLNDVKNWSSENMHLADGYDGFIVTYPPAFALLYEHFGKPIVMHAPVRFDLLFEQRPEARRRWTQWLIGEVTGYDGALRMATNGAYDAKYFEYHTGVKVPHIPSLCDYIDRLSPMYSPRGTTKLLAFGSHAGCRAAHDAIPDVLHVRDVLGSQYAHEEITRAKAVVWVPYENSAMSFHEQYWLGIPIFVPTPRFLLELYESGLALEQLTRHGMSGTGTELGRCGTDLPDPYTREGLEAWMPLYDFYNEIEFPHVMRFDSWSDLREQIAATDQASLSRISSRMLGHNKIRKMACLSRWRELLSGI